MSDTPWTDLAAEDQLRDDDVVGVPGPAGEIALFRVAGQVFATDNQCNHGNARLCEGFLLDHEIECPLHQGRFDIRDGRPTCDPVNAPLRTYPVKVEGGRVWLRLG